jgi:endonuclease/exonuclease/phosphatase family metal-dependent hydrolase
MTLRFWAQLGAGIAGAVLAGCSADGAAALKRSATRPTTRRAGKTPAPTFVVATYNINGLNRHLPQVIDNIRKAEADLVCLQEVNRASGPVIRRQLGKRYKHMVFGLNARMDGFALLSHEPITHRKWVRAGGLHYHSYLQARTKLGGREVRIAAIHLMPNPLRKGMSVADQMRYFACLDSIRSADMQRIGKLWQKDRDDPPTIALGDFNCLSFQGAVKYMRARGFADSAATADKGADHHPTWHAKLAGGKGELRVRIDYIFHTKHLKTLRSRTIAAAGSDHYPVVSTLTWAPRKAPAREKRD